MERLQPIWFECLTLERKRSKMNAMTPTEYAAAVGAEVRAEMARQRRRQSDLAQALGVTAGTAARRLDGTTPFDVFELAVTAEWLGVPIDRLRPKAAHAA